MEQSSKDYCRYYLILLVQDLEEQKPTKYRINGTATTVRAQPGTAIEKSSENVQY